MGKPKKEKKKPCQVPVRIRGKTEKNTWEGEVFGEEGKTPNEPLVAQETTLVRLFCLLCDDMYLEKVLNERKCTLFTSLLLLFSLLKITIVYFFLNSYPLLQVTEESETSIADAMLVDAPNKVQAEHVRSTPVTSDLDPSSHKVKFQINDFVAAVYENSWYIGKIVGYMRDEDNDLFYNIDFMKTTSTIPPKFCWPDRKDELPVPYEDILMVIPSPSLTGTSRRQMYHTLEENILVSVEEKFQNFTEASA